MTAPVGQIPHLLILGDPGSGKTTMLRYLALRDARALLGAGEPLPAGLGEPRFPIYLRIADFTRSGHRHTGLRAFLPDYFTGQFGSGVGAEGGW